MFSCFYFTIQFSNKSILFCCSCIYTFECCHIKIQRISKDVAKRQYLYPLNVDPLVLRFAKVFSSSASCDTFIRYVRVMRMHGFVVLAACVALIFLLTTVKTNCMELSVARRLVVFEMQLLLSATS